MLSVLAILQDVVGRDPRAKALLHPGIDARLFHKNTKALEYHGLSYHADALCIVVLCSTRFARTSNSYLRAFHA